MFSDLADLTINPMNAKQQKFIAEYLVDENGTRAAERAGYKGSDNVLAVQAHHLLSNPKIKSAIDAGLAKKLKAIEKRVETAIMTKEQWLKRLHDIASSDIGDAFVSVNGKLVMTIEEMKKSGFSKLIRKIKVLPGGKVEFDLHAVLPAMELLGKSQGWVKDHIEHSGEIAQTGVLTPEEAKKIFSSPESAAAARTLALALAQPNGPPKEGDDL